MASTPTPYLHKDPGDLMLAADWNEMQVRVRSELQAHDHGGDADARIPRDGLADKAVDGSKIDPDSKLAVRTLAVAGTFKVGGASQLGELKAGPASFGGPRLTVNGDLGVGTDSPENSENWHRVLDLLGGDHAKLSVRAGPVDGRLMSHVAGIYGAEPGLVLGTRSAHPLSLIAGGEMRLRLAAAPAQGVTSTPVADFFPAHNPLRLSSAWTNRADKSAAEICNDTSAYRTLMLVGNNSAGLGRRVSVWDRLEVNGSLVLGGAAEAPKNAPGALWCAGDQTYLGVPRALNVTDTETGTVRFQLGVKDGVLQTDVLRLGNKWRLSAIGDAHGNDGWLRLFNVQGSGYYGGLAAGELWSGKALQVSDQRLKDNIHEIGDALGKLRSLRGVCFDWRPNAPACAGTRAAGLIAQDVERVLPQAVADGPEGWKGIDTTAVIALLVQAIKEQQAMIDALRAALPAHR